ncbi:MAG: hypothetical protein REI12_13740 [Pedobacter sp.]|nr:hypothetical protein [Pedobacter sp.]
MASYFAFPASDRLRDGSLTLLENFEQGVREPQSRLFVEVGQIFTDEIVDALLLNIVRSAENNHSGAKILEQFAGLIKSTVHALIKQVLGKMSNDELRPLAGYMRKRRLTLTQNGQEKDYIAFELPADFHARFRAVLEKCAQGENLQPELLACMEIFTEKAHTAFYDESLGAIKLGFIGRKMADVGGAALRKGSQAATKRLIPDLKGEELKEFSSYFLLMLVSN